MEERAAGAAVGLGDLDAHDAELEQLIDERARDLRLLVHFADERPDLRVGELAHAVAEDASRPRPRTVRGWACVATSSSSLLIDVAHGRNVIIGLSAGSPSMRPLSRVSKYARVSRIALARAFRSSPWRRQARAGPAPPARSSRLRAAADSRSSRSRRASAPASTSSASTSSSPTRGAAGARSRSRTSSRSARTASRRTIEPFAIVKIDAGRRRRTPAADARSGATYDEEREAQRPDVRLFVLLLDDYHVRRGNDMVVRKPLIEFIQNQLAPADMVAIMYPLTPVTDAVVHARPRSADQRDRAVRGAASSTTGRGTSSRSSTPTIRRRPSSASATR